MPGAEVTHFFHCASFDINLFTHMILINKNVLAVAGWQFHCGTWRWRQPDSCKKGAYSLAARGRCLPPSRGANRLVRINSPAWCGCVCAIAIAEVQFHFAQEINLTHTKRRDPKSINCAASRLCWVCAGRVALVSNCNESPTRLHHRLDLCQKQRKGGAICSPQVRLVPETKERWCHMWRDCFRCNVVVCVHLAEYCEWYKCNGAVCALCSFIGTW